MEEPHRHPSGLVGARFGVRAVARTIDTLVHYLVWIIAPFICVFIATLTGHPQIVKALSTPKWYGFLFAALGAVLYQSVGEGLHGCTLGKRLMGIVVVKDTGGPCTFAAATGRSLAFFIDGLFFGLVAYGSMEPPYQQRLGDKWAGTYAVRKDSIPTEQKPSPLHFADALILGLFADAACYAVSALIKVAY